jgi:hypothetical protein
MADRGSRIAEGKLQGDDAGVADFQAQQQPWTFPLEEAVRALQEAKAKAAGGD